MKTTVFVDGQHGTTGLQIHEQLDGREDIEIVKIPEEKRKDPTARAELINGVDFVFLCLPDDAADFHRALTRGQPRGVVDISVNRRIR